MKPAPVLSSTVKGWFTRAIFFGNIAEQCNFEARILPSATISLDRKIPIEIALLRNFTNLVKIKRFKKPWSNENSKQIYLKTSIFSNLFIDLFCSASFLLTIGNVKTSIYDFIRKSCFPHRNLTLQFTPSNVVEPS
jgi:hypothetical protein